MKIKLVIIDSCKGVDPGKGMGGAKGEAASAKFSYFVDPDKEHIDYWKYSPMGTGKVIESRFTS